MELLPWPWLVPRSNQGSELLNTSAAEEEITLLREELAKLRNEPRWEHGGQVAGWVMPWVAGLWRVSHWGGEARE